MNIDVLLADRDEMLVAAYKVYLVAEGLRVAAVTTALDCLEALRQNHPKLLVLDPELPWGGGRGILALLSEMSDLPKIPVIVLTEHPDFGTDKMVPNWSSAFMLKPLAPAALATLVRSLQPLATISSRPTAATL